MPCRAVAEQGLETPASHPDQGYSELDYSDQGYSEQDYSEQDYSETSG